MRWMAQFAYGLRGEAPLLTAELGDQFIVDHRNLSRDSSGTRFHTSDGVLGTLDDFRVAVEKVLGAADMGFNEADSDACAVYLRARHGGLVAEGHVAAFAGRELFLTMTYRRRAGRKSSIQTEIATFLFRDGPEDQLGPATIASRSPGVFGVFAEAFASKAAHPEQRTKAIPLPRSVAEGRDAQFHLAA